MAKLKDSFSAPSELAAKLAESDKTVEETGAEVASLKKEALRADTVEAESERAVGEVLEQHLQRIGRLNVVLAVRNRTED